MTKLKVIIPIAVALSVGLILYFSISKRTSIKTMDKTSSMDAESNVTIIEDNSPDSLYSEYDLILSNATKEFIGYQNIDEGFLAWVSSNYGKRVLDDIVSKNDYSNPEIWFDETGKSIRVLYIEYCGAIGLDYSNLATYRQASSDENDGSCTLLFSGDLSMANDIATTTFMMEEPNKLKDCFSPDLLQVMNDADIFEINNEFTYTTRGTPIPGKAFTFRGNPENAKELQGIGVDIVSLANNHVYDYGEEGLLDTLDTLNSVGMPYLGAGHNLSEAMKPAYFIAGGRKIALVAATQIERSYNYTKEATDDSPGVLKTLNPDKFMAEISEAKKNADFVIVIVHWGTEGNSYYGSDQTELAKNFISAGADVIIGGHTHCLQGIEFIDGIPVYYSLGNYWFSSTMNMPAPYDTGLAEIKINKDGSITPSFVPCHFANGVTSLVTDVNEKEALFTRLEQLSNTIIIDENGVIKKKG